MAEIRVYTYKNCDTCRKATRWLKEHGVDFEELPIRETPPSEAELKTMLGAIGLKRLFNTSGRDYRAEGIKDRLPSLSENDAIALLRANGNLIKRPFLLTPQGATTGFKETEWEALLPSA